MTVTTRKPVILSNDNGPLQFVQTDDVTIIAPEHPSAFAVIGSSVSVPNGTWLTVVSASVTLTATRYVGAWFDGSWTGGNNSVLGFRLSIDGTTGGVRTQNASNASHENAMSATLRTSSALSAGTYTVLVEAAVQSGSACTVNEATLLAMQL